MNTPDIFIITTAWLAGIGYVLTICRRFQTCEWSRGAANSWLLGAMTMTVHIVMAFHFRHHWSHEAAVFDTARQTKELIGWEWGGGVWLNYLLVVVWLMDALWLKLARGSYLKRSQWVSISIQGYLAFMWFNATVVFGSWGARVFGVLALMVIVQSYRRAKLGKQPADFAK